MPYTTNLGSYPANMLPPIEAVASGRIVDLPIEFSSTKQAQARRLRYYGLKKALRTHNHPIAKLSEFEMVHFYARDNVLHVTHVDHSEAAVDDEQRINAALAKADKAQGEDQS